MYIKFDANSISYFLEKFGIICKSIFPMKQLQLFNCILSFISWQRSELLAYSIINISLLYCLAILSSDFILSSLTAPAFLITSTFILMFNDLVFLKNRVKRAHSNIEVSLQKRSELVPDLETAVKKYLEHEKEIHEKISELSPSGSTLSRAIRNHSLYRVCLI